MSRSFFKRFVNLSKFIFEDKATRDVSMGEIALRVGILTTILAGHGIYAYFTQKKDIVVVTKKYKMSRNGFTDFMIIDNKGRHFNVNNSLWYWKWDALEDWHKIEENKQLLIKYYGWRIHLLGLFPNIYISDKAKFLDSMNCAEFIKFESEKLL